MVGKDKRVMSTHVHHFNGMLTYTPLQVLCHNKVLAFSSLRRHAKEKRVHIGCSNGDLGVPVRVARTNGKELSRCISVDVVHGEVWLVRVKPVDILRVVEQEREEGLVWRGEATGVAPQVAGNLRHGVLQGVTTIWCSLGFQVDLLEVSVRFRSCASKKASITRIGTGGRKVK